MAAIAPLLTADDLAGFPDDGLRRELIEGVLHVAAAPLLDHQELSARLNDMLRALVLPRRLGRVFYSPVDIRLSDRTLVQPDLVFIRTERRGICRGNTIYGPPDIVIEVLSPSNRAYDLSEKRAIYERYAVPEYWVFDPDDTAVTHLVLVDGRFVVVPPISGIYRSTVIPDFVVDPQILFAGLDDW